MRRSIFAALLSLTISATAFGQLPNSSGQVWREYPLGPIPAPSVTSLQSTPTELPMKPPTILDIIKRENDLTTWTGPNFGMMGVDGPKLYVYQTPAVQQRIGETVGRFLRPETQKIRFVMEARILTISESFFEREPHSTTPGETMVYTDIRTPVEKYLHPILGRDGKPQCRSEGLSAYWVAGEVIPKFQDEWAKLFGEVTGDTHSGMSVSPKFAASNGQLGAIFDLTAKQFTTDKTMVDGKEQPVVTTFYEGSASCFFSLLSWDGKTVDSDFFIEFSKITRVDRTEPKPDVIGLETPRTEKITLSQQGLRWPAGGMLVVIMGTKRLSEGRVESGTPILNKVPFVKRLFVNTAIGRDVQRLYSIVTIRQEAPGVSTTPMPTRQETTPVN